MRNLLLFTILLLFSYKSYCQEEVFFKVQYLPEKIYIQSIVSTSKSEINYLGPESLLEKIKEKNIENPNSTFKKTYLKSKNKTGKLAENNFPITIEFIGGENGIIPDDTVVFGKVIPGKTPTLDSISAPNMEADFKESFFKSMKNTMAQIELPEKNVKIGESFSREMPLKMPIGKYNLELKNTIVYALKKVENNQAFFDISQTYYIISTGIEMKAEGNGTGQIIYDIKNNFYLFYELKSTINMEVQNDEMNFKGTIENTFTQNTTITTNNN